MMSAVMKRWLTRFERRYDYDAGFLREILSADSVGALKLTLAAGFLSHDFGLPKTVRAVAHVRSTVRADCGSCLRLAVTMARDAGLRTEELMPAFAPERSTGSGHGAGRQIRRCGARQCAGPGRDRRPGPHPFRRPRTRRACGGNP